MSDEPKDDGELARLVEQVETEHGDEGAGAMADHLRDRLPETEAADEDAADAEE